MNAKLLKGQALVSGSACGALLFADTGLSFMGGVNPSSGVVTDIRHPLHGQSVAGKVLAIPSGRGSCAGSLVMFELLMNGHAPAALVFSYRETILTLGIMIALELYQRGIPVLLLNEEQYEALALFSHARLSGDCIELSQQPFPALTPSASLPELDLGGFVLTEQDECFLAGQCGEAAKIAMRIIIRTARLEGVNSLVDVGMAHIDGNYYQGPAGVQYAQKLCALGAKVRVPSSMNSLCVDKRRWREQGIAEALGLPSEAIAEAYQRMGVKPTYTCAPYLLESKPQFGQQIAWGESNAVAFANSVLGARTLKYPDYLDILVAITGRAPNASCHRPELRLAELRIDVQCPAQVDDLFFATLGYHIGKLACHEIPLVCGLQGLSISRDDLKAFSAAFATTSAAAMFHILGVTPEASSMEQACARQGAIPNLSVRLADLEATWRELNTAMDAEVDLVALGNPHFSFTEIATLARLCQGHHKDGGVDLLVTCGREVFEQAKQAGYVQSIRQFGGDFINDTCWCLIDEPIIKREVRNIATNSGKYAHYGPPATNKKYHFASLARCVEAACNGIVDTSRPLWLVDT